MKITIHKVNNASNWRIIEYERKGWKIFIDYHNNLSSDNQNFLHTQIEGLNVGDVSKSLIITCDNKIYDIRKKYNFPKDLNVYSSLNCKIPNLKINSVSEDLNQVTNKTNKEQFILYCERFDFGEFKVSVFVTQKEHSVSFSFKIETSLCSVYQTCDSTLYESNSYYETLSKYLEQVTYIVYYPENHISEEKSFDLLNSAVEKFFNNLETQAILLVNFDNSNEIIKKFYDKWPTINFKPGDIFAPYSGDVLYEENYTTGIISIKKLSDKIEIISNPKNLKCYSSDKKFIGSFCNKTFALESINNCFYSPNKLVGYFFEDRHVNPEVKVFENCVFYPDKSLFSKLEFSFLKNIYLTNIVFKSGDIAFSNLHFEEDILIPVEIESLVTPDILKNYYDIYYQGKYKKFEKYLENLSYFFAPSYLDLYYIVKPLVKIEHKDWKEKMIISISEIYPYKDFD